MIVERLQQFVRSLKDLTDGKPRKLVFFRIGGVSPGSRIEYDVTGNMVTYSEHVKTIDTQILHYLKGALDVEVVQGAAPTKAGGMRLDFFLIIWKGLATISEDDAEQLFWDEPDIGIVKPKDGVNRIKDALRSPFSKFLLDYYTSAPKPVQSYFVDHPEKDAESFYRELLTLLVVGELECVWLSGEPKAAAKPQTPKPAQAKQEGSQKAPPGAAAEKPKAEPAVPQPSRDAIPRQVPSTPVSPPPAVEKKAMSEDEYISSLINTEALERRSARRKKKTGDTKKEPALNGTPIQSAPKNGSDDSLTLLFDDGSAVSTATPAKKKKSPADERFDLLHESAQPAAHSTAAAVEEDTIDPMSIFDAPFVEQQETTSQQKEMKIAGLKKILQAAKKGF